MHPIEDASFTKQINIFAVIVTQTRISVMILQMYEVWRLRGVVGTCVISGLLVDLLRCFGSK